MLNPLYSGEALKDAGSNAVFVMNVFEMLVHFLISTFTKNKKYLCHSLFYSKTKILSFSKLRVIFFFCTEA